MHDLTAITAFGGSAPQSMTTGDVTVTERPDLALASVAARLGQETAAAEAMAQLTGAPAPAVATWAGAEAVTAFWMGPDQWMVTAPFDTHEDIAPIVLAETGKTASVTEQTDGWTAFDVTGAGTEAVLELLTNLDIRRMEPGAANRTAIHHLSCFVLCLSDSDFRILGPRASAGSLYHAITTAMASAR